MTQQNPNNPWYAWAAEMSQACKQHCEKTGGNAAAMLRTATDAEIRAALQEAGSDLHEQSENVLNSIRLVAVDEFTNFRDVRTVTITGAPGSGKTRDVVIPALTAWRGSSMIFDVGGELRNATVEGLKTAGIEVREIDAQCARFADLHEIFSSDVKTAVFIESDVAQGLAEMMASSVRGNFADVLVVFDNCERYLSAAAAARLLDDDGGPKILMATQRKDYPSGEKHIAM